jgi:hypothetical protein
MQKLGLDGTAFRSGDGESPICSIRCCLEEEVRAANLGSPTSSPEVPTESRGQMMNKKKHWMDTFMELDHGAGMDPLELRREANRQQQIQGLRCGSECGAVRAVSWMDSLPRSQWGGQAESASEGQTRVTGGRAERGALGSASHVAEERPGRGVDVDADPACLVGDESPATRSRRVMT